MPMTEPFADPPLDAAEARALLDRVAAAAVSPVAEADVDDYLDPSHEGGLDVQFTASDAAIAGDQNDDDTDGLDDPSHDGGLDPDWA